MCVREAHLLQFWIAQIHKNDDYREWVDGGEGDAALMSVSQMDPSVSFMMWEWFR